MKIFCKHKNVTVVEKFYTETFDFTTDFSFYVLWKCNECGKEGINLIDVVGCYHYSQKDDAREMAKAYGYEPRIFVELRLNRKLRV